MFRSSRTHPEAARFGQQCSDAGARQSPTTRPRIPRASRAAPGWIGRRSPPGRAAACTVLGRQTERDDIACYEEDAYYPQLPTFAVLARVLGVSMDVSWYGEEAEWLAWWCQQD
jgi:hypothetical protein